MQNLQVLEVQGQRVLTTRQLATAYATEVKVIQNNFRRNKDRYTVGKHYIYMDRDELREVKATYPQFEGELSRTSRVNFWTEKGALLHAKSLNTDKAWEVYDYLVDFYFRAKETPAEKKEVVPVTTETEPLKEELPDKTECSEAIGIFKLLMRAAEARGIQVKTKPIQIYKSVLNKKRIAIRKGLPLEEVNFEIAFELFHHDVNYDKGNLIDTPLAGYYNSQAERAAKLIISLLNERIA
ncbi:MAG: ORF6N domain-containing protein [Lachnospiraceae bacterium]|jgi:hypothetical protein|nr:ORF6N domain-containing protein [Lachnospiraceae bacterium]